MSRYRKSLMALVALVGTWGITAAPDGITAVEWFGLLAAIGGTGAVWGVPNDPPKGKRASKKVSERGQVSADLVVLVLIAICVVVLTLHVINTP